MTRRVAFLTANEGVESAELTEPWQAVIGAGHTAELLAPEGGKVGLVEHLDRDSTQAVDRKVAEASPDEYDALVLPGGVANPDTLRLDEDAVAFVRDFVLSGKPVAAICHGPWMLIEAGVVEGRRVAAWPSLQTDLRNAGAKWVDQDVVLDGNLITSRQPDDLPCFSRALLEALG
jgi:protease I